jgi:hypothetical protein
VEDFRRRKKMNKCLVAIFVVATLMGQVLAQDKPIDLIPPEIQKYKIERAQPPSGRALDETESLKHTRHTRQFQGMMELRRTGQTNLSQQEIEEYLNESGLKSNRPKFDNIPVCRPQKPTDICGASGVWMVHLQPFVKISEVDTVMADLSAKYNVRKHPDMLVDYDLPTGAYFVIEASDKNAFLMSQDPRVRIVERDRIGTMTPDRVESYKSGRKALPNSAKKKSRVQLK